MFATLTAWFARRLGSDPVPLAGLKDESLARGPVNPRATAEAQALYAFLRAQFRQKILSGVMSRQEQDEAAWIHVQAGKRPAIQGLDLMHHGRGYGWFDETALVEQAKAWHAQGGILTLSWHWRDPSRRTEAFYTRDTAFDLSRMADPDSEENRALLADMDRIAGVLRPLRDAGIPVLWRPLHEASGGWFWWGAQGSVPYRALWQALYTRLVEIHHLDHLLWIWATDSLANASEWYPGDAWVDVIGLDLYAHDHASQVDSFARLSRVFGGRKLVALTENGPIPSPDALAAEGAPWSYFMTWCGEFTREANTAEDWRQVLEHPHVFALEDLPVSLLREASILPSAANPAR